MPVNYTMVACPQCGGYSKDEHGDDCPGCYGTGRVPVPSRISDDRPAPLTWRDWLFYATVIFLAAGFIAFLIHHAR